MAIALSTSNATYSAEYLSQTVVHIHSRGEYLGTAILLPIGLVFNQAKYYTEDTELLPVENYIVPLDFTDTIPVSRLHELLEWYEREAA